MKKLRLSLAVLLSLALVAWVFQPVFAVPNFQPAKVINIHTGQGVANIVVPLPAIENSGAIVPLGSAFDNGREVQGFAIIHYKTNYAKPPWAGGGKGKNDSEDSYYAFLARGAKWKVTELYVVADDVDAALVAQDLETWDSQVSFNIFGDEDIFSEVDGPDTNSPDGKNEVMFGDISEPGVIAVAIVWGIFQGPPQNRELVEWDVVFDNVDYLWGDGNQDPNVMDFENIATHEFGHAVGLADIYESNHSEQTMYGYADYGETKKRTLEAGDINGVKTLYQ